MEILKLSEEAHSASEARYFFHPPKVEETWKILHVIAIFFPEPQKLQLFVAY